MFIQENISSTKIKWNDKIPLWVTQLNEEK